MGTVSGVPQLAIRLSIKQQCGAFKSINIVRTGPIKGAILPVPERFGACID